MKSPKDLEAHRGDETAPPGSPSKAALRAFKGVNISTAPMEIQGNPSSQQTIAQGKRHNPNATSIEEKKRAKASANRAYFASIGITIAILLVLIIISLERLKTEEEMQMSAYPTRYDHSSSFSFRYLRLFFLIPFFFYNFIIIKINPDFKILAFAHHSCKLQ